MCDSYCSMESQRVFVEHKIILIHVPFLKGILRFRTKESQFGNPNKTAWATSRQYNMVLRLEHCLLNTILLFTSSCNTRNKPATTFQKNLDEFNIFKLEFSGINSSRIQNNYLLVNFFSNYYLWKNNMESNRKEKLSLRNQN